MKFGTLIPFGKIVRAGGDLQNDVLDLSYEIEYI